MTAALFSRCFFFILTFMFLLTVRRKDIFARGNILVIAGKRRKYAPLKPHRQMAHTIGSTKKREECRCATAEYVFCDYIMSQIKTPKDKAIVTVFIITIIAAVFASTAIVQYLTPKKTTMWVFNDNYKAGTPLSEGMLKSVQADNEIVVAGAPSAAGSMLITGNEVKTIINNGDSLRVDVSKDMPLFKSILSVAGGNNLEMTMDPSKIAVTVPADSFSGITSELTEGSKVNVYSTGYNTENSSSSTVLIFQNMRVLGTSKKDGVLQGITLEVTAEQSIKLINATQYSSLYFGLVDPTGYQAVEDGLSFTPTYTRSDPNGVS